MASKKLQELGDMFNARTVYLNLLITANRDSSAATMPIFEKNIVDQCSKIEETLILLDEETKLSNSSITRR